MKQVRVWFQNRRKTLSEPKGETKHDELKSDSISFEINEKSQSPELEDNVPNFEPIEVLKPLASDSPPSKTLVTSTVQMVQTTTMHISLEPLLTEVQRQFEQACTSVLVKMQARTEAMIAENQRILEASRLANLQIKETYEASRRENQRFREVFEASRLTNRQFVASSTPFVANANESKRHSII